MGCTENAPAPTFRLECECGGIDQKCKRCSGRGKVEYYRCPLKLVTHTTRRVMRFYNLLQAFSKWPRDLDLLEQSNTFLEAITVISSEINLINDQKNKTS